MNSYRLREQLSVTMIAVFFDVCQTRNLSLTARRLQKSKSQVSTLLRKLEEMTGLTLVQRDGKKLTINEQGLSLGKTLFAPINLMIFAQNRHRLQHARQFHASNEPQNISYIRVKIPIRFFGGGMSQALIRSVAICRRLQPDIFIYCEFFDNYNYYHYDQTFWSPDWTSLGELSINYCTEPQNAGTPEDWMSPWCVLRANTRQQKSIHDLETLRAIATEHQLVIPKMPWEIMQQMVGFLEHNHIPFIYHDTDYTQLLNKPLPSHTVLLVNRLLLTTGLVSEHLVSPFPADLRVGFRIQQQGNHRILSQFQSVFLRMVQKPAHYFPVWQGHCTWRQWNYFYQVMHAGSFVQAAQRLFVSQPAVSKQINQMEKAVGAPLINRQAGKHPLAPTAIGRQYLDIAEGIFVATDDFIRQIATQSAYQRQDLNLGILPSIDKNSYLLDLINKISRWQKQFPELRINIIEERHQHLLSLLHNQEINLAITEADAPSSLKQYPISPPEPLGLVIHPDHFQHAEIPSALNWQEIVRYPLILLRNGTGIRSAIEQQCSKLGIDLNIAHIAMESDSLNLNQQWVENGEYATILPRSAMGSLVAAGRLIFIPLTPTVSRVLKISHLSARRLNPFETSLLDLLRCEPN